jgi:threonine/homoserine/homoserine lactone efflux protein
MSPELLIAFAIFALVSSITPGPNNLMLMASGANFGVARSMPHALGVSIGFMLLVFLVGIGLGSVFHAFPVAQTALKALCAAYLLYLAWKVATAAPPSAEARANAKPFTFVQAAAFQWINPKGWSMALTAIAAYAPTQDPMLCAFVALVFGVINFPAIGLWMGMGVQMRRVLANPKALRVFNVTAALLLVASLYPVVFASA